MASITYVFEGEYVAVEVDNDAAISTKIVSMPIWFNEIARNDEYSNGNGTKEYEYVVAWLNGLGVGDFRYDDGYYYHDTDQWVIIAKIDPIAYLSRIIIQ